MRRWADAAVRSRRTTSCVMTAMARSLGFDVLMCRSYYLIIGGKGKRNLRLASKDPKLVVLVLEYRYLSRARGVRERGFTIYGKKSVRIAISRFVFSDTSRLGQIAGNKNSISRVVDLYSIGARIRTDFFCHTSCGSPLGTPCLPRVRYCTKCSLDL